MDWSIEKGERGVIAGLLIAAVTLLGCALIWGAVTWHGDDRPGDVCHEACGWRVKSIAADGSCECYPREP